MTAIVDNYYDQRRQEGPITSGFISNSDIRQKEKDERIKWERQKGYEEYINKKKEAEQIRREKMYMNARDHQPPPEPVEVYDHDQVAKELREERKNEYNDYLDNPNMGFRQYEDRKKMLSQERKDEYNQFLDKKREQENQINRRKHPYTPPTGLNIATEQDRKRVEDMKKSIYREELLKQQQDQLYQRALRDGDVHVANRTSPTQAPPDRTSPRGRPPQHPNSGRRRDMQNYMTERKTEDELRTGFFDDRRKSPPNRDERRNDYADFLADKEQKMALERQKREELRKEPYPEVVKGDYYNADTLEQKRRHLNDARREEYQNYLSTQKEKEGSGPINEVHEDFQSMRRNQLAQERNKEYKQFLEKQRRPMPQKMRDRNFGRPHSEGLVLPQLKTSSDQIPDRMVRAATPNFMSLNFNEDAMTARETALALERKQEYNNFLRKEGFHSSSSKVGPLQLQPVEDDFQTKRQKELVQERHQDYLEFLNKTNQPTNRLYTPADLQGLPISQRPYDVLRQNQEKQRNKEYNEHLAKKTPEGRRREWLDNSDPKGIIAGVDSYNYDKRRIFAEERKQEYKEIMEKRSLPTVDKTKAEVTEQVEPSESVDKTPAINLNAVKIFPVGEGYAKRQRELQAERRKNYKAFAQKKSELYKKQQENRDNFRAMLDRDMMESPPIIPVGEYDSKKRQFQQEAHQEMIHFLESQPHGNRDKEFWNKVTKPRILPQSGEYKNRRQKLNDELRKDWRDYVLKQEPPKERIKDFGTAGAVLFTGEYEKTRQKVREERTKEFQEYLKKYGQQKPRRMADLSSNNSIGFMSNLGFHERERERLNKEKRDEYNKYLDENAYGRNGMPYGRPNWVDGKDSWYNQDPPPFKGRDDDTQRGRPGSYRRQSPSYQEILDSKRRQEASYRRFDDQEYSRGAPLNQDYARQQDGYNIHGRYE